MGSSCLGSWPRIRGRSELLEANVDMVVPEVFPSLCGRRVLVMEFVMALAVSSLPTWSWFSAWFSIQALLK